MAAPVRIHNAQQVAQMTNNGSVVLCVCTDGANKGFKEKQNGRHCKRRVYST